MKNTLKILATIVVVSIISISCQKDDKKLVEEATLNYLNALECLDFSTAQEYATPESRAFLHFFDSIISIQQTPREQLAAQNKGVRFDIDTIIFSNDSNATIHYKRTLGNHQADQQQILKKIDGKWLVDFKKEDTANTTEENNTDAQTDSTSVSE